jgi:hypothetical protein
MILYHGSSEIIETPDVLHSYRSLDFGKGFYLTTNRKQAERWARRKAELLHKDTAYVNVYEMSEDIANLKVKIFAEDLHEWIDFVCDCRDGKTNYLSYDIIMGKVAGDKVFRVVDLYHSGIWNKERAIREIKVYPEYDQIAFITQEAIDKLLVFKSADEV